MRVRRIPVAIRSLRDAIAFLEGTPGQLVRTSVEVDPEAELAGVYRRVGAGGTVGPPASTARRCCSRTSRATRTPRC